MATRSLQRMQSAFATDVGRVRAHNEDALAVSAEYGLAIVADGMGGYNAGEVASGIATALLKEALEQRFRREPALLALPARRIEKLLADEIQHANASIYAAACQEAGYKGMGTTLVLALLRERDVVIAHIGDSRAYRFRDCRLAPLTRDHSLLQQQLDAGLITAAQARAGKQKNLLTRGMGVDPEVDVDVRTHGLLPGDLILLCTDGLTDELPDSVIELVLTEAEPDLDAACGELTARANAAGGADNITVLLAGRPLAGGEQSRWQRLLVWLGERLALSR
ncbi:Stp1/IreP family PP2C-type Ser/Thr phosphatase [Lacisediminimonas sp.]|uniref:Stp1/IreP family PP2C-type Ser/Thr phosphatase n=1 Tax=Lacisediminimonas sp. TaxID=3060582 RepID=UPI0027290AFB|nr:Stp1/IreP family PP2C-type Ser/Thr phosphatase [Lacisediminimonas sp.]MDO8300033.1 Stp1/IreP family PP2C-type Ser/Thr phosphatase [Lacisediminimonas sp.]